MIFSVSYGWPEVYTCNSVIVRAKCNESDNGAYISRANIEIAKLGALGISVLACSQDEGAPSVANLLCSNKTHPVFGIYPASSPYLTSVSATTVGPESSTSTHLQDPPICDAYGCTQSNHEEPCTTSNTRLSWTTGGGFSEFMPRPSYQDSVVVSYVNGDAEKPPANLYWPNNRGYPDTSAVGARVLIIGGGSAMVAEGTSASTPIIAGMVTLLNDWRFNNNQPPLGFLVITQHC